MCSGRGSAAANGRGAGVFDTALYTAKNMLRPHGEMFVWLPWIVLQSKSTTSPGSPRQYAMPCSSARRAKTSVGSSGPRDRAPLA